MNFGDVIKLRISRWGDYAVYPGEPNVIKRNREKKGGRRVRKGDMMLYAEEGVVHSQKPRDVSSFWKLEKGNEFSPKTPEALPTHFKLLISKVLRKYICVVLSLKVCSDIL